VNKLPPKVYVLGIPVSPAGVGEIGELFTRKEPGKHLIVTFVNPLACALTQTNADYVDLLNNFDIVACDGIGMVHAARASGIRNSKRESFDFTSLADPVFRSTVNNRWQLGIVGGEPGVAEKSSKVLRQKYPGLQVAACYSGFGREPADAHNYFIQNQVDLVICAMGAPLQEKFFIQLVAGGWHGIGFTCGGFLDQVVVGEAYYPEWVDRLNIRFLYRLVKEPRRLWRRYLVDYQVFLRCFSQLQWKRVKAKMWIG
jgi:exopolysaccharide biosynthesis WecB/TagA/CpsF family protein